jgi:hypothetical protein
MSSNICKIFILAKTKKSERWRKDNLIYQDNPLVGFKKHGIQSIHQQKQEDIEYPKKIF